jgi:two-component system NarL family sensor kinase
MTGVRRQLMALLPDTQLRDLLVEHAWRGVRVQLVLRVVLAVFALLVVVLVPPTRSGAASVVVAAGYAAWTLALVVAARTSHVQLIRWVPVTLVVDVVVLCVLCFVASSSDETSWTTDVLVYGFFLLPVIAATQLRAWVCVLVSVATTAAFFVTSVAAREANGDEPWGVLLLSTLALAGVGLGCVLLSRVQAGRVLDISRLADDRATLLTDLVGVEERERRDLAEALHDGALQYLLAARLDLPDVAHDAEARARLDHALTEAVGLLRATTTELHPAVLERAGLPVALRELARGITGRASLQVTVDDSTWPAEARTDADALLLATSRELLTNVVKHARATTVTVRLALVDGEAALVVKDDGVGASAADVEARAAEGHVGLTSRRVRVSSAGGTLVLSPVAPHGTRVECRVPAQLI